MKAGDLYTPVDIQEDYGTTTNDMGEPINNWRTIRRRFAEVVPLKSHEIFAARQMQSGVTHRVKFRSENNFTFDPAKHRIRTVQGGSIYHIEGAPRDDGFEVVMEAIEKV